MVSAIPLVWFWTVLKLTMDYMCFLCVDMFLLCLNNMLCYWCDALGSPRWTVCLFISLCELIFGVITINE